MPPVHIEKDGDVTIISMDRPEARNAVDDPTAIELEQAFQDFDDDSLASVAVFTGRHGVFCAGADLKAIGTARAPKARPTGRGPMGPSRMLLTKPVIAAIEGYAVAGGLELALWCDMRVAANDAVFGVFCRRWGVPLIDGGTVRLPRLIGHSRAMDMILTGRTVMGDEALAFGLANRLVEPGQALSAAISLAHELGALPQNCLRSDRLSALAQWSLDEPAAISQEFELGFATLMSGESLAGAQRFSSGAGRHGSTA